MRRRLAILCTMLAMLWLVTSAGHGRPGGAGQAPVPASVQAALAQAAQSDPGGSLSVIVQTIGDAEPAAMAAAAAGARVTDRWRIIDGFAAEMAAGAAVRLAGRTDVKWIALDSKLQATARAGGGAGTGTGTGAVDSSKLAGAYPFAARAVDAWKAGLTGNGIGIAIVDSGIEHSNGVGAADLGARVVADVTFNSAALYQADRYGHGTHVAGIAAGNGQYSSGKYIGIAPKANLFNVKFSADNGSGIESDLISALDWVYVNRDRGIRIVNLSVNSSTPESYTTSAVDAAVEKLWNSGIVVVVAAGNRGASADAVQYPPANDPLVITVGALDDRATTALTDDVMTAWSSRGRTQDGFTKPEIVAPGARMVSLKACDACTLMQAAPANAVDSAYFRMGGTSMAAPVVSGTVALMLEQNPGLTPNQVKWILMNTGRSYSGMAKGGPKAVDALAASTYAGTPGTANAGIAPSGGSAAGGNTGSNVHWLVSLDY